MEEQNNQQVIQQPQPEMHSSGMPRMAIIIGVIILMALVGVGGYILGTKNGAKIQEANQQQPVQVSPTATTAPSPTISAAIGMKTYSNGEVPFQLKYPNNWQYTQPMPNSVTFTGNEGRVNIIWGSGFGGAYCIPMVSPTPYPRLPQGFSGCITRNDDGSTSYVLMKELSSEVSVKLEAQATPQLNPMNNIVTQILESIEFKQ
jgi:hypothetical protein